MSDHSERMANVNPAGWEGRDTAVIKFHNTDTVSFKDISLLIRLDGKPDVTDIGLSVSVTAPEPSVRFEEDFNISLGKLPGRNNKHPVVEIPYRNNVLLDRQGEYIFKITHKGKTVKGIDAIGIASRQLPAEPVRPTP